MTESIYKLTFKATLLDRKLADIMGIIEDAVSSVLARVKAKYRQRPDKNHCVSPKF